MAPTVCSEKKVRVAGMKEGRQRSNMGVAHPNATSAASTAAAGATQASAVLNYVAKGLMNSTRRLQRRRGVRLPPRLPQSTKRDASTSTSATDGQRRKPKFRSRPVGHMERMNYNGLRAQLVRTHSSSSSSSSSYSNLNNIYIKTVLQPTTANNSNSNNCVVSGNNKTTTATVKLCDHGPVMQMKDDDDDDMDGEEEDRGDGDSGYEFALEPVKLSEAQLQQQQQQLYHSHNQGLLSIAIKTINLVQRNNLLQKRLTQLQLETSQFIASVLANPENRHFREKIPVKPEPANKVSNVLLRH